MVPAVDLAPAPDSLYAAFSESMEGAGPFGDIPDLAVAVSGGADSLALVLLAWRWVCERGGRLRALTVDHCLRPESAEEARQVADWMALHGIEQHTLVPCERPPSGAGQEWARRCRYALLEEWCCRYGVVHLLLGHHRQDQDETRVLRRHSGSGAFGLAGMAPVATRDQVCLLRPLLGVDPSCLRSFLDGLGQSWIDDPSNANERYARVRIRRRLSAGMECVPSGMTIAGRYGFERRVDELLALSVRIDGAGFALVDHQALLRSEVDEAAHALRRVLMCIGGLEYPPRQERLKRILSSLWQGGTLGRCVLSPQEHLLLVTREARDLPPGMPLAAWREEERWDGRFLPGHEGCLPEGLWIAPLGRDGMAILRALPGSFRRSGRVPVSAMAALPSFWLNGVLVSVPQVGYSSLKIGVDRPVSVFARFAPHHPLGSCGFRLADGLAGPM